MSKGDLTIHFHQWGILQEDFYALEGLHRFYKEISYGTTAAGVKFVTAMEAHAYPIFSMIYHPEYRLIMDANPDTVLIATTLSKLLGTLAAQNLQDRLAKGLQARDDAMEPQPVDSMVH